MVLLTWRHLHFAGQSPSKSPAGVNRRNAVLFTRKKQAASSAGGGTPSKADNEADSEVTKGPAGRSSSSKKVLLSTDDLELAETEVRSPQPPPPPPPAESADEMASIKTPKKKNAPKSPPKSPPKQNKKTAGRNLVWMHRHVIANRYKMSVPGLL